jgi:hypothetical protein
MWISHGNANSMAWKLLASNQNRQITSDAGPWEAVMVNDDGSWGSSRVSPCSLRKDSVRII